MKKHFLILLALLSFSAAANAQLVTSRSVNNTKKHEVWMDFGAGLFMQPLLPSSFSGSIGLRWTKNYMKYFAMDYVNFSVFFNTGNMEKKVHEHRQGSGLGASLMLGPKAKIPISDRNSLFANFNAGVAVMTFGWGGYDFFDKYYFKYRQETGIGIIFHERLALSLVYAFSPIKENDINMSPNYFQAKFSFSF